MGQRAIEREEGKESEGREGRRWDREQERYVERERGGEEEKGGKEGGRERGWSEGVGERGEGGKEGQRSRERETWRERGREGGRKGRERGGMGVNKGGRERGERGIQIWGGGSLRNSESGESGGRVTERHCTSGWRRVRSIRGIMLCTLAECNNEDGHAKVRVWHARIIKKNT